MPRPWQTARRKPIPLARPALDITRVTYIAGLLDQGATAADFGTNGRVGISLGGKVVATTEWRIVKAARAMGQGDVLRG